MNVALRGDLDRFRTDYAAHRADEGRAYQGEELRSLPYLLTGPLARQWAVRARSFEALRKNLVRPMARQLGNALDVLDLGAGNGWLSYRLALDGHRCRAIDIRDDDVDGLGASTELRALTDFKCLTASFDELPLPDDSADLAVFNAALHYATDLAVVLAEATRCVRSGGCVAILDSPFYRNQVAGKAMVREKHRTARAQFGERASSLLSAGHIEFLTRERLGEASSAIGLRWRRRRVWYPLWYELRPLTARLRGARQPSRFDLWTATVP